MNGLNKNSKLLLPLLALCIAGTAILFATGYGKKSRSSTRALPVQRALPAAGAPAAQNAMPQQVDATTSASFKLEPYIPYHDTLKKWAYSTFAGQRHVLGDVIQRVERAVVGLSAMESFGASKRLTAIGSALIVDPRGYVLAAARDINEYADLKVILFTGNHRHQFDGIVETVDPAANLALVKIQNTGIFTLPFCSIWDYAPVTVGDWVIAIGSTDGLHLIAMQGMVSSANRSLKSGGRYFYDLVKTDLKIEGGMTGSPVFDIRGRFVGLYIGDGLVQPINETSSPLFAMNGVR